VDQSARLAVETLNTARRWVQARVTLRRALDSKTAPPAAVERAKAAYTKATEELEGNVLRLERMLHAQGKTVPSKRGSTTQFPYREFFGMVAAGAKAVSEALEPPAVTARVVDTKKTIIDVEPE